MTEAIRRTTASSHSFSMSRQGIDVNQALGILSSRHQEQVASSSSEEKHDDTAGPSSCCARHAPPDAASMGQVLDLLASDQSSPSVALPTVEEKKARQAAMLDKLESMTTKERLQKVLQIQEERARTYKAFDRGLQQVLQTGNVSGYPNAVTEATASFSVLSDTIRAIQEQLKSSTVTSLQKHEQEKLQLTAALHLERIRLMSEPEDTLLRNGVTMLQGKLQTCVESINEVLDEIRCTLLEDV